MTRHPARLTAALILAFLVLRAVLFEATVAGEYRLYRDYGDAARATSLADLYRTRDVEYPQLAVEFGAVAGIIADALPRGVDRLVGWRPNKFEEPYLSETAEEHEAGDRYEVGLGIVLFAVDVACLVLVYFIARKTYPNEGRRARIGRLVGYAVATGLLGLILYDRQDLVCGFFALLALLALAHGRSAIGYALLTVGTGYKLVPALLLPIWVLATAVVRAGPGATPVRYLRAVVIEAVIAGLILTAWPVLAYTFGGQDRAFFFLTFHKDRGLQLEAPVGWPVLLIDPSTEVGHSFGSFNMRGEVADAVAKPLKAAMLLSVALGTAITLRGFWRVVRLHSALRTPYSALLPQVVAGSLLVWLGFIVTNKVGSPQYLMWVAPLVPLLPLRTAGERWWAGLFAVALILTSAVFPCAYKYVVGPLVKDDPPTWAGPIPACEFLLAARSVTLIVVTFWLAVSLWRSPRVAPSPIPIPVETPA